MCCGRAQGRTFRLGTIDSVGTRPHPCHVVGLEGGPSIHNGPDALVDRWGLSAPLRIRGAEPCTVFALLGGG